MKLNGNWIIPDLIWIVGRLNVFPVISFDDLELLHNVVLVPIVRTAARAWRTWSWQRWVAAVWSHFDFRRTEQADSRWSSAVCSYCWRCWSCCCCWRSLSCCLMTHSHFHQLQRCFRCRSSVSSRNNLESYHCYSVQCSTSENSSWSTRNLRRMTSRLPEVDAFFCRSVEFPGDDVELKWRNCYVVHSFQLRHSTYRSVSDDCYCWLAVSGELEACYHSFDDLCRVLIGRHLSRWQRLRCETGILSRSLWFLCLY